MNSIKGQIGQEIYDSLESEANKEVALAKEFEIVDKYGKKNYYRRRQLLTSLLKYFSVFQEKELLFTPTDITDILFEAKLLFAVESEDEFRQRKGGGVDFQEPPFVFKWEERSKKIEEVIGNHLEMLLINFEVRTLVTEIRDYTGEQDPEIKKFFAGIFEKFALPFSIFLDEPALIVEYQKQKKELQKHTHESAKEFFGVPSIGFSISGTNKYVFYYAMAQLRTFLNMLRIGGFLNPGQIQFGGDHIEMIAPTSPVFLGTLSHGSYYWDQDMKKPWEKIPDGCLFRSFGYRGITKFFLDIRTYGGIEQIFINNKIIFEKMKNPWENSCINDIEPILDILSSATQIPDIGAKILQINCCLEHLFVPREIEGNQQHKDKYIIGAINALNPKFNSWFRELYKIRCDYAHRGYIQRDKKSFAFIFKSVRNTLELLTAKLLKQ